EIDADWDNIRAAWEYAVARRSELDMRHMALTLIEYCKVRGVDGQSWFEPAVTQFKSGDPATSPKLSLGVALMALGINYQLRGEFERAYVELDRSLSILKHYDCPYETALTLVTMARISGARRDVDASVGLYKESLAIAETLNDPVLLSRALLG